MILDFFSRRTVASRNYLSIVGIILGFFLLTMPASGDPPLEVGPAICGPDWYGDMTCCPDMASFLDCAAYSCRNYCYYGCWYDNPTSPPTSCNSGRTAYPGIPAVFNALLLGHVRINDPHGTEITNSLVFGRGTFPACPSGPGVYTVHMDLVFFDCYTCVNATPTPTPTTEPTQNITPTVTPTPTETPIEFTFPTPDNDAPIADFSANPRSGNAPLTVSFTDTSTHSPTRWMWLFGDGETSTVKNPTHTFTAAGTYNISLTAANAHGGNTSLKTGYVTVTPAPVVYTFSMTNIEKYANPGINMALNYPSGWTGTKIEPGTVSCSYVSKWLNDDGWTQKSYKKDQSVGIEDFGSQGRGLNEATFHYHYGHGEDGKILLYENNSYIQYSDVIQKWGNKNKWVMIDSCLVLPNDTMGRNWGKALESSHGILGFATESQFSYGSGSLFLDKFFEYALKNNETITDAYKHATEEKEPSYTVGAAVFKNSYQYYHDHFPGHGEIAPDEESDDNIYYYTWSCKGGTEEKPWWQLW